MVQLAILLIKQERVGNLINQSSVPFVWPKWSVCSFFQRLFEDEFSTDLSIFVTFVIDCSTPSYPSIHPYLDHFSDKKQDAQWKLILTDQ